MVDTELLHKIIKWRIGLFKTHMTSLTPDQIYEGVKGTLKDAFFDNKDYEEAITILGKELDI